MVCLKSDLPEVHLRGSLHQPLLVEHQEEPEETKHDYSARIIKSFVPEMAFQ
jgi:hypothetical protein